MPIRAEQKPLYSPEWPQIRSAIRKRAQNRCERCRVPNYAVGHRDGTGRFWPTGGTLLHDEAGGGLLSYREARRFADDCNEQLNGLEDNGERAIVIVLTTAHLDHDVRNNDASNLAFLCQKCHNRHDAKMRAAGVKARRCSRTGQLCLEE